MPKVYEDHIDLLGFKAQDKVTGLEGVIDAVCFDLYGCIQVSLKPKGLDKDNRPFSGYWLDVTRLDIEKTDRVMGVPNFKKGYVAEGKKGATDKKPLDI